MRKVISKLLGRTDDAAAVDLKFLTSVVRRYTVERQQVPRDLVDLVTQRYLDNLPTAPVGQRFVIDRKAVEVRLE